MKPKEDEACRRAWNNRLDVRPIVDREMKRPSGSSRKPVTGFQARILCALANVHPRTLVRWREGRSRPKQTKRIVEAVKYLEWTSLLDEPFEDPASASDLGE